MSSDDECSLDVDLFTEPKDYYPPAKPATHTEFTLLSGATLRLRLVGHNPLWGHHLWNGAQVISTYLQTHAPQLVNGKTILELGAGAGLPSLVAAILGANKVVVTDYPDADLVENIRENIDACCGFWRDGAGDVVVAEGYLWGAPTASLVQHLPRSQQRFDILLLADLLFNHHCHAALVSTIVQTLARTAKARALVFFTPYRPWLLKKDLDFFDLCGGKGLVVEKVVQERMKKVMFVEDRGDEILRRTVFGYEVYWRDLRGGGAEELWL